MKALWLLIGALSITYPVLVYFGLQRFEPKILGLTFVFVYLVRLLITSTSAKARIVICLAAAGVAVLVWGVNSERLLVLVPVIINFVFCGVFLHSLFQPPTIPAKFARRSHGELDDELIRYTDGVTYLWIGFFIINGSIAAFTAFFTSRETWTLYNGFIAYILIGLVFLGELGYRNFIYKKDEK